MEKPKPGTGKVKGTNTEELFELWRNHIIRKTPAPEELRNEVWRIASEAVHALIRQQARKLYGSVRKRLFRFKQDATLLFLEFIVRSNTKSIGWCFKTFKIRFTGVLTLLEAQECGLMVSDASLRNLESLELMKLSKGFREARIGGNPEPIISGLHLGMLSLDELEGDAEDEHNFLWRQTR